MELEWVSLSGIGENVGHEGKQSATLRINLDSGEEPWYPEVAISVMVDRRPDLTWAELEEQIRANARAALDAALTQLDGGTIDELRHGASARSDRIDAERDRRSQEKLQKALFGIAS